MGQTDRAKFGVAINDLVASREIPRPSHRQRHLDTAGGLAIRERKHEGRSDAVADGRCQSDDDVAKRRIVGLVPSRGRGGSELAPRGPVIVARHAEMRARSSEAHERTGLASRATRDGYIG